MKVAARFFLILCLLFVVSGCSKEIKEGTAEMKNIVDVKFEFDSYLGKRDSLIERDLKLYDELTVGFYEVRDQSVALETLNKVIPEYESLLDEAQYIDLKTPDMQDVHDIFIDALKMNLESLYDYKKAYEEDDEEFITSGDDKMWESMKLSEEHDEALLVVAKEYRIDFEFVSEE